MRIGKMFERNRIDNSISQKVAIPVELTFDGGPPLRGKFILSSGRTLGDALNGNGGFVEFEPYGGERIFVAKSALRAVKAVAVPHAPSLGPQNRETDDFDPFVILGVARGTAFERVRASYLRLAKQYHPDRYEGVDLPREVKEYLSAMAGRINVAYSVLEGAEQAKTAPNRRMAPVYSSPARA
jgi:hypothetical protein